MFLIFLHVLQCDLPSVAIDTDRLNRFVTEQGMVAWFPTSAKDNINIGNDMSLLFFLQIEQTCM